MEGFVNEVGRNLSLKPASGGLTHQMTGKKYCIIIDGSDGVATVKCPDKTQFKHIQFMIIHAKGTSNYTVVKDGDTTIKTFAALGHCHVIYDSLTDAWIAI